MQLAFWGANTGYFPSRGETGIFGTCLDTIRGYICIFETFPDASRRNIGILGPQTPLTCKLCPMCAQSSPGPVTENPQELRFELQAPEGRTEAPRAGDSTTATSCSDPPRPVSKRKVPRAIPLFRSTSSPKCSDRNYAAVSVRSLVQSVQCLRTAQHMRRQE